MGAVPSINLPRKSLECGQLKSQERRHLNIVQDKEVITDKRKSLYKNLDELYTRGSKLQLHSWTISKNDDTVSFQHFEKPYLAPKLQVVIDDSLAYTCATFGWLLPEDHIIYKLRKRSMRNVTISNLLYYVLCMKLCPGLESNTDDAACHTISCELNILSDNTQQAKTFYRSKNCELLIENDKLCEMCTIHQQESIKKEVKNVKNIKKPAHSNASLSCTHPNRVKLALQEERAKTTRLAAEVECLKDRIQKHGVKIDQQLAGDIDTIMSENMQDASPFMKLFWNQQKYMLDGGCRKYHPMIIRFCLSIAYDELRDSNVLVLPSRRTLRETTKTPSDQLLASTLK